MIRTALATLLGLITLLLLGTMTCALALSSSTTPGVALGTLPGQVADIPPDMLTNYVSAADATGLDWAVLAAIGKIESDHNRSQAPGVHSGVNFAGCCAGSMQISLTGGASSTWARYAADGDHDGRMSIYDPADAVLAAARYLKASGAPNNYQRAIFAYNHAQWYVDRVQTQAAAYRSITTTPPTGASAWQVLSNPRVLLTPIQRSDIAHGLIDPRIVTLLDWIATQHTITISALRSDHSEHTTNGSISNHAAGRAVDIAVVDGQACQGTRDGTCGRLAVQLAQITGPEHLTELIYCFDPDPTSPDAFAAPDHCNHIHAGYDAT